MTCITKFVLFLFLNTPPPHYLANSNLFIHLFTTSILSTSYDSYLLDVDRTAVIKVALFLPHKVFKMVKETNIN